MNVVGSLTETGTIYLNGNVTTSGSNSFNAAANYTFNGTAAQVTGKRVAELLLDPAITEALAEAKALDRLLAAVPKVPSRTSITSGTGPKRGPVKNATVRA